jgi:hypothetical protein
MNDLILYYASSTNFWVGYGVCVVSSLVGNFIRAWYRGEFKAPVGN